MRLLVLMLAVLAGFKVWFQNDLYRQAAERAVAEAYRARASAACQKLHQTAGIDWTAPNSLHLTAGNRELPVQIWQVDHAQWNARFKDPYLVLTAGGPGAEVSCAYAISGGQASLALASLAGS